MNFQLAYDEKLNLVNQALNDCFPDFKKEIGRLREAVCYSVFSGGKRLRPVMLLAAFEFSNTTLPLQEALPFACAIECIHTYSLIHDDLPAMDDDDFRRGKPTCHKVYGEAMAILAGDALLNIAFELMGASIEETSENPVLTLAKIKAMNEISKAAGFRGMIGGQVADMIAEGRTITKEELSFIHRHKTGALFIAAIRAGLLLGAADELTLTDMTRYAEHTGLAFQIKDDVLDIDGDETLLGKKLGSDIENDKATFPALHGMAASYGAIERLHHESMDILKKYDKRSEFLMHLTNYLLNRKY